jgi:hypothetical protein
MKICEYCELPIIPSKNRKGNNSRKYHPWCAKIVERARPHTRNAVPNDKKPNTTCLHCEMPFCSEDPKLFRICNTCKWNNPDKFQHAEDWDAGCRW